MAITVTLTPDFYSGKAGDTVVFVADVQGLGTDESVDSYTWKKGGVAIPNAPMTGTHTLNITDATSVGDFSVTAQIDTGTSLENYDSNSVTIVFGAPTLSIKATPNKFHEFQSFTISGKDSVVPSEFTWYRYEWWIDGVHDSSKDSVKAPPSDIVVSSGLESEKNKKYILKIVYDTIEANASPRTISSSEFSPVFQSLTDIVTSGITSTKDSGTIGDTIQITAVFDDIPAGNDIQSLQWKKDGINITGATTGSYDLTISNSSSVGVFSCVAKIGTDSSHTVDIESVSKTITFTAPVELPSRWTVHPIPWRDTSFTPLGYWVLDEILLQKALGKDWKKDYADYEYTADVQTILQALNTYGECLVQDSRNGYIHKMSEI